MVHRSYACTALSIAVLTAATPARAQQDANIGDFSVRVQKDLITDDDRSSALLYAGSSRVSDAGLIAWSCAEIDGGMLVSVRVGSYARSGDTQRVVWRFDSDRPDTTYLEAVPGATAGFLRQQDVAPFTVRARTASRLVIRVPGDRDYVYDLRGSASALNRLACARNPRVLGTQLRPRQQAGAGEQTHSRAERTYDLSAVEERPSPINTQDLLRTLEQNYPPPLRDARVSGTVQVRMRVLEDGSVDPNSITITRSSHEQFNDPTIRSVQVLRFRPAKVNGRPVRAWVDLPIHWTVD